MTQEWQGKTDGNRWMQQQLIFWFRFLNLRIYYAGVACTVPFYMLFGKGFHPSYRFYRKRLGMSSIQSLWYSYKNHYRFGQVMIDRFACYAGKHFDFTIDNYAYFEHLAQQKDAFAMLSAHVGNFEIGGYSLVAETRTINMLVFADETETVMENREIQFGRTNIRMIPMQKDMSHLFAINNALYNGEVLSMTADRCNSSAQTVKCSFFGSEVYFPMGPFATIALRNLPTLVVLIMKEGLKRYHIFIHRHEMPSENLSRQQRIEALAQQYGMMVEAVVRRYPEQWFNFFDLWKTTNSRHSTR